MKNNLKEGSCHVLWFYAYNDFFKGVKSYDYPEQQFSEIINAGLRIVRR